MALRGEGDTTPDQFHDGVPITRAEAAACQHPDLRDAYAIDGPI